MTDQIPNITVAEMKVMKVIWRIGRASVRDVKRELDNGYGKPAYS
jgi:predicted transcriptional regulator